MRAYPHSLNIAYTVSFLPFLYLFSLQQTGDVNLEWRDTVRINYMEFGWLEKYGVIIPSGT